MLEIFPTPCYISFRTPRYRLCLHATGVNFFQGLLAQSFGSFHLPALLGPLPLLLREFRLHLADTVNQPVEMIDIAAPVTGGRFALLAADQARFLKGANIELHRLFGQADASGDFPLGGKGPSLGAAPVFEQLHQDIELGGVDAKAALRPHHDDRYGSVAMRHDGLAPNQLGGGCLLGRVGLGGERNDSIDCGHNGPRGKSVSQR